MNYKFYESWFNLLLHSISLTRSQNAAVSTKLQKKANRKKKQPKIKNKYYIK